jgi:FAD/FMN-containing dehydrogenase
MHAQFLPSLLPSLDWITDTTRVAKLSQDFNWYSPVLKRQLSDKSADIVVRPTSQEQIQAVASACATHHIPLTIRGTGTGNYGQCVPLQGGVVLDMSAYNQVLWIENGIARAQSGIRLIDFDRVAKPKGHELRWIPSTFRSATLGGLYGGGFGGAGSINYGPIASLGNILKVKIMSVHETPQILEFEGHEALNFHHTYGTNAIVLELEFALAPSVPWMESIVCFDAFEEALHFANELSIGSGYSKKEVCFVSSSIPPYFTNLCTHFKSGAHAVLTVFAPCSEMGVKELAQKHKGDITYLKNAQEVEQSNRTLIEYTWNHTTLHALKVDKSLTYIQSGFDPTRYVEQIKTLEKALSDEVMMHIEFIRTKEGLVNASGLQIVRYSSDDRLQEIMQIYRDHGVQINNPHVYTLEDGKSANYLNPKILTTKDDLDPQGLLNPGKLRTWVRKTH